MIPRLHLFEFEDFAWCPKVVRKGVTDFLEFATDKAGVYDLALPEIRLIMNQSNRKTIVDLCSGSGGPWYFWNKKGMLSSDWQVILTDYYPPERIRNPEGGITQLQNSVSALDVPSELAGVRTIFTALHHFRPEQDKEILSSAVNAGTPILAFELTRRHFTWFAYCLLLPFLSLLSTPFYRSLSFSQLFFTYLVPIIPFVVFFDGVVSGLRTYSPNELKSLYVDLETQNYKFETRLLTSLTNPIGVTVLIGKPQNW